MFFPERERVKDFSRVCGVLRHLGRAVYVVAGGLLPEVGLSSAGTAPVRERRAPGFSNASRVDHTANSMKVWSRQPHTPSNGTKPS